MKKRILQSCLSLLCAACATPTASTALTAAPVEPPAAHARPHGVTHAPSAVKPLAGLLPAMPEPVTSFGAASAGGYLYVLGGYSGEPHVYSREGQSDKLSRVRLDGSGEWEQISQISSGLQGLALAEHAGKLCRVGGTEARNQAGSAADLHSVRDAACFDPATQSWTALPALPTGRSSHEIAVIGSTLYVAGGWTLQGDARSGTWREDILALDLAAAQPSWSSIKAPFKRRALGVAGVSGKLVIVGGITPEGTPSRRVDVYDPRTQSWTQGPDYPVDAFGLAAEGVGDAVFASARDGVIYRWKLAEAAWRAQSRLAFGRFFHQLIAVNDSELVAVGGISGMHNDGRTRHVEHISLADTGPRLVAWSMAYPGRAKNRQGVFVHGDDVYLFGGNTSLAQHDFEPDNFVDEAFRLHLPSLQLTEIERFPARRQTIQTVSRDTHGVALGGFGHDGSKAVSFADGYVFDFESEHWREGTRLPESRTQFGLTEHGGQLWVFGGLNYDPARKGEEAFAHVTRVLRAASPEDKVFTELSVSLPGPRRAFAGAVSGDAYFLVGGMRGGFDLVEDCLRFNFKTQAFAPLVCPEQARLSGALVPARGKLYLSGGSIQSAEGMKSVQEVSELDPSTGKWRSIVSELPFDTRHMHAVAFQDRILLISTHNDEGRMNVALLDPEPLAPQAAASALVASAGGDAARRKITP